MKPRHGIEVIDFGWSGGHKAWRTKAGESRTIGILLLACLQRNLSPSLVAEIVERGGGRLLLIIPRCCATWVRLAGVS